MSYDDSKAVRLKALIAEATAAKQHLAIEAGALAQDILDLIPAPTAMTLPTTGWTNGSGVTGYPYYYDLTVSGATATDAAEVSIGAGSQGTAAACGLCPACETRAGAIRFFAAAAPSAAITGSYILSKTNANA